MSTKKSKTTTRTLQWPQWDYKVMQNNNKVTTMRQKTTTKRHKRTTNTQVTTKTCKMITKLLKKQQYRYHKEIQNTYKRPKMITERHKTASLVVSFKLFVYSGWTKCRTAMESLYTGTAFTVESYAPSTSLFPLLTFLSSSLKIDVI